jgi:DNA damage-inducible protein 1
LSISNDTSISDFLEFVEALLPSLLLSNSSASSSDKMQLLKYGKILYTSSYDMNTAGKGTTTLREMGIVDNDIIACRRVTVDDANRATNIGTTSGTALPSQSQQQQSLTSSSVGLDFTNLLQDYSSQPPATNSTSTTAVTHPTTTPVDYIYHGSSMNLQEAQYYNPHPTSMVKLLYDKPHLLKELNYYAPTLAQELISLQQSSAVNGGNEIIKNASEIYRNYMIQQSITSAFNKTSKYHLENEMRLRHAQNPNDKEASEYVQKQERQKLIQEQYEYVMNEYPESVVGRVLMLYIPMKINGFPVAAFIDSGAQQTIMSLSLAKQCQIDQYIDTRMAGIAVGVGTGVILGRIHIVQIEITSTITNQIYYFPCSITVMDDPKSKSNHTTKLLTSDDTDHPMSEEHIDDEAVGGKEMPFLFGLDMLKRHLCCLDMSKGCLRFTQIRIDDTNVKSTDSNSNNDNSTPQYLEVPFLHEKDLLPAQGGTMKSNHSEK